MDFSKLRYCGTLLEYGEQIPDGKDYVLYYRSNAGYSFKNQVTKTCFDNCGKDIKDRTVIFLTERSECCYITYGHNKVYYDESDKLYYIVLDTTDMIYSPKYTY